MPELFNLNQRIAIKGTARKWQWEVKNFGADRKPPHHVGAAYPNFISNKMNSAPLIASYFRELRCDLKSLIAVLNLVMSVYYSKGRQGIQNTEPNVLFTRLSQKKIGYFSEILVLTHGC